MKLTLPIYVTRHESLFTVRPLFFPDPVERHAKLERALFLLAKALREHLRDLGKLWRHDDLARYTFYPDLQFQRINLAFDLRRHVHRGRFLFVLFEALGRRVAFTPSVPDVWFELQRGETLAERATEVLTHHFRLREKEDEEHFVTPERLALQGTGWITPLDLEIYPTQSFLEEDKPRRAALAPEEDLDGEGELHRVGRNLDHLFPDDLDRVVLRESALMELTRLLRAAERRPVLLLGPPLVGKTALLHEHVYRTVAARKDPHHHFNNTWLLAPQRLISGMSYVGQWEQRLLAILKIARKRNHILYFDDFLGLYSAGNTAQSTLSVANVLKPFIERREVRLITEMTPEAYRVLRERDRGFADLFHILPLAEPDDRELLRILIASLRQLEGQHRCRFDLDVLPTVLDLTRRYVRHQAFPGKAAVFLRRLAVKYRNMPVGRDDVLREFQQQSGLSLTFLDARLKLAREDVVKALEGQVIGQPAALSACADVISIAKARINDPDRPLASFLFLGPTGVGKTQCAKALADYLFGGSREEQGEGDVIRLLRFDMNEFLEAGSAARLVGTFFQPEGLLTSAVRRRPFSVVLFDEIEKAHTEVFDLLLQVLGEGRLTDALGRTVDFTNCLLVLTSNLGVRQAQSQFGYIQDRASRNEVYLDAAQRFFRPEFFNRLDRVVPFGMLLRSDVARIARLLLADLLRREGLVRRKNILLVQDQAMERVIDQGFDPLLGARALKRALERALAQPIAARLARGLPEELTAIHVYSVGEHLLVEVEGLQEVPRDPMVEQREELLEQPDLLTRCQEAMRRISQEFAPFRPLGEITVSSLAGEHYHYFQIQERLENLRSMLEEWQARLDEKRQGREYPSLPPDTQIRFKRKQTREGPSNLLRDVAAAADLADYLAELIRNVRQHKTETPIEAALDNLAVAHLLTQAVGAGLPEQVVVLIRQTAPSATRWDAILHDDLRSIFSYRLLGLDCHTVEVGKDEAAIPGKILVVRGTSAWPLVQMEVGTHLFCPAHEGLVPVQVLAWPLAEGRNPLDCVRERHQEHARWQQRLLQGNAERKEDPWRLLPCGAHLPGAGRRP